MTDLANVPVPLDLYDPVELLSFVPYRFSFEPHESVVFLTARRQGGEVTLGVFARFDIDSLIEPRGEADAHRRMAARLHLQQTCEGFMVVYSDDLFAAVDSERLPAPAVEHRAVRLSQMLTRWFDVVHFAPSRTYVVSADAWRCLACPEPHHCPPGGHPRSALAHTTVAAWMVLKGRRVAPRREDLIVLPPDPPPNAIDQRVATEIDHLHRHPFKGRPRAWRKVMTRRWASALDANRRPVELSAPDLCLLALSLHSVSIRDNVIYAICTGKEIPQPHDGRDSHFSEMFRSGPPAQGQETQNALEVLEEAAGHCPRALRVPILTTWAWCHWWNGNGAQANILVDLAREQDPFYSLAETLDEVLFHDLSPPWVAQQ